PSPHLPSLCFFFTDTAPTETYTLSLHDALPISPPRSARRGEALRWMRDPCPRRAAGRQGRRRPRPHVDGHLRAGAGHGSRIQRRDRKSTRLNSSHVAISYAVFSLKKKKNQRPRL